MKAHRQRKIKRPNPVRSSFRGLIVALFAILGGYVFFNFSIPVLNGLSNGITHIVAPQVAPNGSNQVNPKNPLAKPPTSKVRQDVVAAQNSASPVAAPVYNFTVLNILPFILLGAILGGYVGTLFLNTMERLGGLWDKMELGDKVNAFIGAFAGIFASLQFLALFQSLEIQAPLKATFLLLLMVGFGGLVIYALQSMSEVLPWTKMRGPVRRSGIRIMDTNVIIDGRIEDVAKTGFLDGELYVPGFVVDELQFIADSSDDLRRKRGRRGLEVLKHMRADFDIETHVYDKLAPEMNDGVDSRLVRLARALGADLLSNDFNLKRVAELQDVKVLSLNDLAVALRPNVLPLETLTEVKIVKDGNQPGQGIGYLEDGTMVVVENGHEHIGQTMDVEVTQVHQTERGKMIFAKVSGPELGEAARRRRSG